jgi:outer membrane protein assembly factor BamB
MHSRSRYASTLIAATVLLLSFTWTAEAQGPQRAPNSGGEQVWLAKYNGPGNGLDAAHAVGVSPDNSAVYVTGGSTGDTSGLDYATGAFDAGTGARLWGARYNGPGNSDDVAVALGVSPDGSAVYVTGSSMGATTGQDYATIAYDAATGAVLWRARYNGAGNDADLANALSVSPDGSVVFITGASVGGSGSYGWDYATIAYDAATGARLWHTRYDGGGEAGSGDLAYALGVSPDGSAVFVTGARTEEGGATYFDYETIAYDALTGATLWRARYGLSGDDVAYALAVSPDSSTVLVTGYSQGHTGQDYATIAYDAATGGRLWGSRYLRRDDSVAYALAVSPDSSTAFVTGRIGEYGDANLATVAYDVATGDRIWAAEYAGPGGGEDVGFAVGVSPDGSAVFVTGSSVGVDSTNDVVTAAFDAGTGARLWISRYTGSANSSDIGHALAVSSDGSALFVTGESGVTGYSNYVTIAYRP